MAIKPPKKLELEALSQYGMRLLAQRARSVGELRQKLWMRAERESDVDQVMAKLKALRVLDDTQYAEHYAETQARSNRVGRQRVMRDLLQKRVARTVAQKA